MLMHSLTHRDATRIPQKYAVDTMACKLFPTYSRLAHRLIHIPWRSHSTVISYWYETLLSWA